MTSIGDVIVLLILIGHAVAKLDKYFTAIHFCATQSPSRTVLLNKIPSYSLAGGLPGKVFCTWQCNKDPKCQHFNYKPLALSCEMYYSDQTCFIKNDTCIYFENQIRGIPDLTVNVALHKPAYQSSNWASNVASLSVDGNPDSNWGDKSCSSTNDPNGGANWWMVNLERLYHIHHVVLVNRNDKFGSREDYFIVGVTNCSSSCQITRGGYPLCGVYCDKASLDIPMAVFCQGYTVASSVIIQQHVNAGGWLNFCEIEVFANK